MLERSWRKGNPPTLLVGMYIGAATMEKQYGDFFKKLKTELPCDPAIPLLGIYPKYILIRKDTCTPMFIEDYLRLPRHGSNLSVHQQMNG